MLWAALKVVDVADRLTILRELASELAASFERRRTPTDKTITALASLHAAADVLGHSPTQYEYRRLALELPELNLVPDATLRTWLGGVDWNTCLARALLDTVSDGDFVTANTGSRFTEDELVAAVRQYIAEHDGRVPSCAVLLAWARDPDVRARAGRRPLSHAPFTRYGGYLRFLERHGFVTEWTRLFDVQGRVRPIRWRFSDAELLGAINEVATLRHGTPREADYRDERERRREQVAAGMKPPDALLPSVSGLKKRFGPNWSDVLQAAGHESPPVVHTARAGTVRTQYSRDQVAEALTDAWTEIGEPFTQGAYQARRHRILTTDETNVIRLPSVAVVCRIFGGWANACEQCLPPTARPRRRRRGDQRA
jgi:hypothetical protein